MATTTSAWPWQKAASSTRQWRNTRKALQIKPDSAEAHQNLGIALANRGQLDEAIAHFRKAVEAQPDDADAHYNLGTALANRGQLDEAIAHFQKTVEARPDYADAYHNLGIAWASRGRLDEATANYQKALVLAIQQNDAALARQLRGRLRACEARSTRPASRPPSAN